MSRSFCAGALVLAEMAGCGGAEPSADPTGYSTSAIENGTVDAAHTFAVGIVQTGSRVSFCSGALLAPNLVATARHCVVEPTSAEIDCSVSVFGPTRSPSNFHVTTQTQITQTGDFAGVSKIVVPTGSDQNKLCGNDIALLILDRNIQLAQYVVPAIDPPMTDHVAYSTHVTAIGYGITSPTDTNGATAGVRRMKQNVGLVCIPNDTGFRPTCFNDPTASKVLSPNEFVSGDASTCEGDSGSGAYDQASFDQGKWVSFGVLSRGAVSPDNTTCIEPIYTRFDAWGPLLIDAANQAAAMGGYKVASWALQLQDGAPCSADRECVSKNCLSQDTKNFVCASPCSSGACAVGFNCTQGFCLPTPPPARAPSGACTAAPTDGSDNVPFHPAVATTLALLCLFVTRRRMPAPSRETPEPSNRQDSPETTH
jgi:Trypsin